MRLLILCDSAFLLYFHRLSSLVALRAYLELIVRGLVFELELQLSQLWKLNFRPEERCEAALPMGEVSGC